MVAVLLFPPQEARVWNVLEQANTLALSTASTTNSLPEALGSYVKPGLQIS